MAIKQKLTGVGVPPVAAQNIVGTVANNLVATGNNQATALFMSLDDWQIFTNVAASTGAIFSPGTGSAPTPYSASDEVTITNHGANALTIYPATGGKIANGATNAGFSIPATKSAFFQSIDGISWAACLSA
jgi:hypothetical protein